MLLQNVGTVAIVFAVVVFAFLFGFGLHQFLTLR